MATEGSRGRSGLFLTLEGNRDRGWTEDSSRAQGTSKLHFLRHSLVLLWGVPVPHPRPRAPAPFQLPRAYGLQRVEGWVGQLKTGWICLGGRNCRHL